MIHSVIIQLKISVNKCDYFNSDSIRKYYAVKKKQEITSDKLLLTKVQILFKFHKILC